MEHNSPLSNYHRFLRLVDRLRKKGQCTVEIGEPSDRPTVQISADKKSAKMIESYLGGLGTKKLFVGFIIGLVAGIIAAYLFIPMTASYLYSSKKGLLPPQYDALIRMKSKSEQALQILEHEFKGNKKGGVFGKKHMVFSAPINDSTTIELSYLISKKGVVKSISQKKGTQILEKTMKKKLSETGIDSAAKKYAGMESPDISDDVADAVTRTADMKIEKAFRSEPVIRIKTKFEGRDIIYANFFTFEGKHKKAFSAHDANSEEIKKYDHTKYRRKYRVPTTEDEYAYNALVGKFVEKFFRGEYVGKK